MSDTTRVKSLRECGNIEAVFERFWTGLKKVSTVPKGMLCMCGDVGRGEWRVERSNRVFPLVLCS